jgi:hypothetical protein
LLGLLLFCLFDVHECVQDGKAKANDSYDYGGEYPLGWIDESIEAKKLLVVFGDQIENDSAGE